MQNPEREHTHCSDSTPLPLQATKLVSEIKSQHNPAKQVLGLLREKRDAEGAPGPGECDSAVARRVCKGLDPEGAGSVRVEHQVG